MDSSEKKEKYLSWEDVLNEIRKNIKQIILFGLSGLIVVLLVMLFFVTPKYTATTDILVNQKASNDAMQWNAQQTDLQAINTYKDVLKKNIILQPALKELREKDHYQGNLNSLSRDISVSNQVNSLVISITAKAQSPGVAADMANTVSQVFKRKITKMMHINNVTIVSSATPNRKPVSPNLKMGALVGLAVGLLIGVIKVILVLGLDNTVKSEKYLSDDLGLVNLGIVYHMNFNDKDYGVARVIARNRTRASNVEESSRRV